MSWRESSLIAWADCLNIADPKNSCRCCIELNRLRSKSEFASGIEFSGPDFSIRFQSTEFEHDCILLLTVLPMENGLSATSTDEGFTLLLLLPLAACCCWSRYLFSSIAASSSLFELNKSCWGVTSLWLGCIGLLELIAESMSCCFYSSCDWRTLGKLMKLMD